MIKSDQSLLRQYYSGKQVLVTGHTGFKGSWLAIWLNELGANVIGYALDPFCSRDNFVLSGISDRITDIRGDIRDKKHLSSVFLSYKPDIVFHLAAQPLVRFSYEAPVETYETNVMGTINVLEGVRATPETKTCICITTDKCYDNKEHIWGYREDDPMGGYDPYSSSKGACEIAINSWRKSFFNPEDYGKHTTALASVRAGNVIGGGDWSIDRIIPDCIRSIEANEDIEIRSPQAIRPWEHVLEPLSGYLLLGLKLSLDPIKYAGGWNFGPDLDSIISVWDIASLVIEAYGKGNLKDISDPLALHEAQLLALDISKARFVLGWKPTLSIKETISLTINWYKQYEIEDVYGICVDQINSFYRVNNE
ncbi:MULTISPECIES: CDP-glucose 4,6-dehydratase [unclassified Oceanispirochaeta]|uniref:CDP-glucose 4,6-dehydratase n=1 Tax=unclassified Oceanispirochaeta TaxID=2635722 RepID=UPI000E095203|nr:MULTISPECIES: CDP-glucose 4,6-dehydratase [unclassified Oceanispirochaeta]MBF9018670.1 CDP-glucose 4,6-dehydratase [Oceanispirochaeta sp. M2]NPD75107.1 CDP-glucose 4,6-dehydratase [Oceanispirochaeta sp. M1]RDG29032.1 CDP-glucose 4,6-dehydratase [Oceanispirochaeta sp. M1]